jgi:putative aldouronate transport system substrate-binding protein
MRSTNKRFSIQDLAGIKHKARRPVFSFLTALMVLSFVLSSCGSNSLVGSDKNDGNTSTVPLEDRAAEQYQLPIVTEPFTLTFATADNPDISNSYTNDLPAFQELEKRTGIHVDFEVTPSDQYNTTMQTRLAAATDLPDLIRLPDDPIRYAKGGLIIPLDDLIGNYAPNIIALFKQRPEVKKAMTAPDGKIYTLSAVVDARSMVNLNGIGMRKDWLRP